MSSVDPEATSSSSGGWILEPNRQQATSTDGGENQATSTSQAAPSATPFASSTEETTAHSHDEAGDGSIEPVLHLLVDDLESASA